MAAIGWGEEITEDAELNKEEKKENEPTSTTDDSIVRNARTCTTEQKHSSTAIRKKQDKTKSNITNNNDTKIPNLSKKKRKIDTRKNGATENTGKRQVIPGVLIENISQEVIRLTFTNLEQCDDDESLTSANKNVASEVAIIGRADMTVIKGAVEVMGHTITAASAAAMRLDSPAHWMSALVIRNSTCGCNNESSENSAAATVTVTEVHLQSVVVSGRSGFDDTDGAADVEATPLQLLSFEVVPTNMPRSVVTIPQSWKSACDNICESWRRYVTADFDDEWCTPDGQSVFATAPRVLVCGAKNQGKSTAVRYIVNRLLSEQHCNNVTVLDCDVGQPELSPPGMLTLTNVRKPLLSPPYVHMVCGNNPEACAASHENAYFFGNITSKSNPMEYTAAISNLMYTYENMDDEEFGENDDLSRNQFHSPLVINTDGWIKGMGFELLTAVIDRVGPHHILQIQGSSRSKIFDLSSVVAPGRRIYNVETACCVDTLQYLQTPSRGNTPLPSRSASVNDMTALNPTETPIPRLNSTINVDTSTISKLSSSDLRRLRLCAYFLGGSVEFQRTQAEVKESGIIDRRRLIARTLASAKPYMVPFKAVHCHMVEGNFDFEMMLAAMNGCVVGLCSLPEDWDGHDQPNFSLPNSSCVGLGIIRSIDRKREIFYVLTPVCPEILKKVNLFIRGKLDLPLECIYQGPYSDCFSYISCDGISVGVGNTVMKSKYNPTRKCIQVKR